MIRLHVIGLPAQQGSKTRMPNGAMVEGSTSKARANLGAWRQAIRAACRHELVERPQPPITDPVAVTMLFSFPAAKSNPDRHWHATTPDWDKIARSTGDALVQGGLLADDRLIAKATVEKTYCEDGPAGCLIIVTSLADSEAENRAARRSRRTAARKAERTAS